MRKVALIFVIFITLISCQTDDEPSINKGSLQFSIKDNSSSQTGGREKAGDEPTDIILSISSASGDIILEDEKLNVTRFGDTFLVDPLQLNIGDYNLTKFLVLNAEQEVIFATPLDDSDLASLVDNPLPIAFTISSDEVTDLDIEVISTSSLDPENFGYSSISFNVVSTIDILVSTFSANIDETHYEFVESLLTVIANEDTLFTQSLGDSINVVKLRTDIEEYTFIASTAFGVSEPTFVLSSELDQHVEKSLDIIIPKRSAQNGLYALIGDEIVRLNAESGEATSTIEINNVPESQRLSSLTFNPKEQVFYLVKNPTNSPALVKVDLDGNYYEIGNFKHNGQQVELVEALAYDHSSHELYVAASLNGGINDGDFWSESLMTVDMATGELSFVTEIITNVPSQPESDMDDLTIYNGTFYLSDGAPPGANFSTIYTFEKADLIINQTTQPDLLYTRTYLRGSEITIDNNDQLYLTSERELYELDVNTPNNLNFIGQTHSTDEFEGQAIRGLTYIR